MTNNDATHGDNALLTINEGNFTTASSVNRGLLSSADWTAFNNKFTLPALTSGSVLFSNGTTIAQDNSNLFWDNTNKRLGIGTNSPGDILNIVGSSSVPAGLRFTVRNTHASGDSRFSLLNASGYAINVQITSSGYPLPNIGAIGTEGNLNALEFITNGTVASGGTTPIKFKPGGYDDVTERLRINPTGNAVQITTGAAGNRGLVIRMAASPTANPFEIQDNTNTLLSGFDASGRFYASPTLTATTVGAAGAAAALPATPTGYLLINVNGTPKKVPYYDN